MPQGSRAGTPAVFFDPTGRRRRFVQATLLLVICVTVTLTALELIGLTARAPVPRVVVGTGARHVTGAQALTRPGVTASVIRIGPRSR